MFNKELEQGYEKTNSINEIIRARINKCSDKAAKKFINSVRPIYGASINGNPIHIGSCLLLQVDGNKYIVTAAHIIDENKTSSLYIGGKHELVLIEGDFLCTSRPDGDRSKDHYDFALMKLNSDLVKKIGYKHYCSENELVTTYLNPKGRCYLALGYPHSRNKKINLSKKSVKPYYLKYTSIIVSNEQLCKKLKITGNDHYFLSFDPKKSKDSSGNIVNSVAPRGISGGALIDLGDFSKPYNLLDTAPCTAKLTGMMIENHPDQKAMVAVSIRIIIDQILNNSNKL